MNGLSIQRTMLGISYSIHVWYTVATSGHSAINLSFIYYIMSTYIHHVAGFSPSNIGTYFIVYLLCSRHPSLSQRIGRFLVAVCLLQESSWQAQHMTCLR